MAWSPRYDAPYVGEKNYMEESWRGRGFDGNNPWYRSTSYGGPEWPGCVMPNCTGWVWGRYIENGAPLDTSIIPLIAPQGDCTYLWNSYPDEKKSQTTPNAGSIAVWGNHVAIVEDFDETTGNCTLTYSSWADPNKPSTWQYRIYWTKWQGHYSEIPGKGFGGFLGYILFDGSGPTPGHWEKRTLDVTLTFCDTQSNPSVPDLSHWITPSETIKDINWQELNKYTEERQIRYNYKSAGYWSDNDWSRLQGTEEFIKTWSN